MLDDYLFRGHELELAVAHEGLQEVSIVCLRVVHSLQVNKCLVVQCLVDQTLVHYKAQ